MLQITNLIKHFTNAKAVDGISFSASRGKILGLIGPNGAGKTTTIRILLNILSQDSGEVLLDGIPWNPEMRNRVGYLPEERGLYQKNKIVDVMLYLASLKGVEPKEGRIKIYDWLKRFDMLNVAKKKVEELSKGNQQKIQFITALLHDPEFIILDEPFSGLDPVNQLLLKDILQELKSSGKLILFSTHQMETAEKLCDEICMINKGKVCLSGTLKEVKSNFKSNTIKIEFDGNGQILNQLDFIKSVNLYENSAECELNTPIDPKNIISVLNQNLSLRKIEFVEPSLETIFLQIVKSSSEAVQ